MHHTVTRRSSGVIEPSLQRDTQQSLHRGLYFTLQLLRGRPVGLFMRRLQARERLDRTSFERLHLDSLKETLRYAHANVPLYSTGGWREALGNGSAECLQAWPVLDRSTVRMRADELLARRVAPGSFYRRSSASTGAPLRVAWNPHGAAWGWANEYRAMLWHGVAPGVRTLLMWGSGHPLQDWVKNCRVFLTAQLGPNQLDEAIDWLMRERPGLCMGLPSALTQLAQHLRARCPDAPWPLVPFAKLGGEQVYPFQREELKKHLGARIVESYGCTEVGPIAAECPEGSMHVLADNVHVEIFRGEQPVPDGEFGEIVVTSLSNRAMPLVRCRIGDCARLLPQPCACGRPLPVLAQLVGRASDLFLSADGRPVHGSALGQGLRSLLSDAPPGTIGQLLFQQLDQRRWKVLVEGAARDSAVASGFDPIWSARLCELVRTAFGRECRVEIERVPRVPREASGKFRYYRPAPRNYLSPPQI